MATAKAQPEARFAEQVRTAPFIFSGRIVKLGASTLASLAPTDQLAIVTVDAVFRAPAVLGPLQGKRLTIQLAKGKPMKAGSKALFFATGWLYGADIAVVEMARGDVPKNPKEMAVRVARAELQIEDDELTRRLKRADLVISGMVADTSPVEREGRGPRSEHDPIWWRAEIAVDRTEKGKLRGTRVEAYFPASLDEYWLDVPKLEPRQRGVFILHKEIEGKRARTQPPGLALLDPLDFQPQAHLQRVRVLLKLISAPE